MTTLIPVTTQTIGTEETNAVNARDLHESLGGNRQFANWIKEQIESLGFEKDADYEVFNKNVKNPQGGRPQGEYILTIETAKHIAMASRTPKGKEVRKYFIQIEKVYLGGLRKRDEMSTEVSAPLDETLQSLAQLRDEASDAIGALIAIKQRADMILENVESRGAEIRGQMKVYGHMVGQQSEKIDGLKDQVKDFDFTVRTLGQAFDRLPLDTQQLKVIRNTVNRRARELSAETGQSHAQATRSLYAHIINCCEVESYHEIKRDDFAYCITCIENANPWQG